MQPVTRIILTGGAGFIGSHTVDAYIDLGLRVSVIDNFSSGQRSQVNSKAKIYQADVCDSESIKKIIEIEQPQVINHHAAHVSVRNSNKQPTFDAQQNILGLLTVLESAKHLPLAKFIFSSSGGAVYGDQPMPVSESSLTEPTSQYGVSKRACELYLQCYESNNGLPYVSLRYSNVYGERQSHAGEVGIVGMIIKAILNKERISVFGDGSQTRDYIHVQDVVEANIRALHSPFRGVVNIGTGHTKALLELIAMMSNKMESLPAISYLAKRREEQQRCVLTTELAKTMLGWSSKIMLEEGLDKTIEYYVSRRLHAKST